MGILSMHMYKIAVPIHQLVPAVQDVPPGLEAVIMKCLSKKPEQRYQTMHELVEELTKVEKGDVPNVALAPERSERPLQADPPKIAAVETVISNAPNPVVRSRWPMLAGAAGILTAAAIVTAIFVLSSVNGEAKAEHPTAIPTVTTPAPTPSVVVVRQDPVPAAPPEATHVQHTDAVPKIAAPAKIESRPAIVHENKSVQPNIAHAPPVSKVSKQQNSKPSRRNKAIGEGELSDPWLH